MMLLGLPAKRFFEAKQVLYNFGFDSERLKSPLQLEAEVEVRNAGTPIIARIYSGLSESFEET